MKNTFLVVAFVAAMYGWYGLTKPPGGLIANQYDGIVITIEPSIAFLDLRPQTIADALHRQGPGKDFKSSGARVRIAEDGSGGFVFAYQDSVQQVIWRGETGDCREFPRALAAAIWDIPLGTTDESRSLANNPP